MKNIIKTILSSLLIISLTACNESNPSGLNDFPSETVFSEGYKDIPQRTEQSAVVEYNSNTENISFGSFASENGGWIYYVYTDFIGYFDNNKSHIYKVCNDGTEETLLYTHFDGIIDICSADEWIYFTGIKEGTVWSEDFDYNQDYMSIYKIRTDGTEKTELMSYNDSFHNLLVSDGWIYFTIYKNKNYYLYKIRTDGSEPTILTGNAVQPNYIDNIIGDWIYFHIQNQEKYYKILKDGTQEKELSGSAKIKISSNIVDGWSYYTDAENNICKINMHNDEKIKLNSDYSRYVNAAGDWIYYVNNEDSNIYKIRTDGSERTRITDGIYKDEYDLVTRMALAGDWLYYECDSRKSGPGPLCRIKTNGTGFKILYN